MTDSSSLPSMTSSQPGKVRKVMGEYKRGDLHSGSKHGPIVRDPKQAIAIALSQARNEKRGGVGAGLKRRSI